MKNTWKIKMALFAIIAVAAMAAVVMWLWNWLIPVLFHGPEIDYLQSLGLMLLSRILFRGFIGGPKGMCHGGNHGGEQWKSKWSNLTPDEKEKMRDLWKKRCGSFDCNDSDPDKTKKPE
ncbi:MAG: hypothetical protein ACO1G9_11575 [Bacteroidota bacterium]